MVGQNYCCPGMIYKNLSTKSVVQSLFIIFEQHLVQSTTYTESNRNIRFVQTAFIFELSNLPQKINVSFAECRVHSSVNNEIYSGVCVNQSRRNLQQMSRGQNLAQGPSSASSATDIITKAALRKFHFSEGCDRDSGLGFRFRVQV